MKTKHKVVVAMVGCAALYFGASRMLGGASPEDDGGALLFDRAWVDKRPDQPTEYVQGLYASEMHDAGVFFNGSNYDIHIERFDYKKKSGALSITFPQSGKSFDVQYKIKKCKDKEDFDLCLDLKSNPWGGPTRYYGVLDPSGGPAELQALRAKAKLVGDAP